ncbi:hypothetical protein RGR602_PC02008 (plasmid) [Rhizobium gallicum bv. gallicum R602sp]|uniref:Uncharacterized protein n=1 Tax=Rhizobium gallicum bv. gallicum R602sp TaxID=1041138 RepID=A0A0B4XG33_9HYPH|nr:hypothetical protein RGR602_PC02008 [Rhizobium gallicum bv. gallicum R602sp]
MLRRPIAPLPSKLTGLTLAGVIKPWFRPAQVGQSRKPMMSATVMLAMTSLGGI